MAKAHLKTTDTPGVGNPSDLVGHTILVHPNEIEMTTNVRSRDIRNDDVLDLMRSLKRRQYQNVAIKPNPDAKNGQPRFIIMDGRRRLTAAKMAVNGDKALGVQASPDFRIRAFVFPNTEGKGNADTLDTFAGAYAANAEAEPMTPMDQAHTYNRLRTEYKVDGPTARKIMGGFAESWATVLQKLLKLSTPVRDALDSELIDARTASDLVGLDDKAVGRVLDAAERAGKARKKQLDAAKEDPSIKENEAKKKEDEKKAAMESRRVAREEAQEEKRKQREIDKAKAAKENKKVMGRPSKPGANLRKPLEIRAAFANLIGNSKLPQPLKDFAIAAVQYINGRCGEAKLYSELAILAGMKPGEIGGKAEVVKDTVTA